MATDQRRILPRLRITAEQLYERAKQVREKSGEAIEPDSTTEKGDNECRGNEVRGSPHCKAGPSPKRQGFQLEPTTTEGSDIGAPMNQDGMRGRSHQKRSQHRASSDSLTSRDTTPGHASGGLVKNDKGPSRDDTVTAWKKYCAGKIERIVASWSESRAKSRFMMLLESVEKFQELSERLVLGDLETSVKLEVCSRLWKHGHYPVIEALRRIGDDVNQELETFLHSSNQFYSLLLTQLQSSRDFSLSEYVTGKLAFPSKTKQRQVMLAVSLCHHCYISLGDLSRYTQQLSSAPEWGKPRILYLKARELAPKDGRPYNQLAVVALKTNHRLDAVYYYMRSLMAKNPFKSAHDSLVGLFEDTSTKVRRQEEEQQRSKVKAEKAAARKQRRQRGKCGGGGGGCNVREGGGLREERASREVWVMPGYNKEVEGTGGVANSSVQRETEDNMESEPFKKLLSTFLIAHGKLFTKIGIETMDSTVSRLTRAFSLHISHTLTTSDSQRLVQMMVINVFSIYHAADTHTDNVTSQQFYCGLAVTLALRLTTILLQQAVHALEACSTTSDGESATVFETLCVDQLSNLLPSVRVWFQWLEHQRVLWRQWTEGIDRSAMFQFWTTTCSLLNLSLNHLPGISQQLSTALQGTVCRLWEDRMLAGFLPLGNPLSTLDTLSIPDINTLDKEQLREQCISRLADIGRLCVVLASSSTYGLTFDTASDKFDIPKVVSDLIKQQTPSPPAMSDADEGSDNAGGESESSDDIIVESSGEENEGDKEGVEMTTQSPSEIDQLKAQKEMLTRKIQEHSHAVQTAKNLVDEAKRTTQPVMRITPRYLVPDTNCFVDMLDSIEKLIASSHFTVAVPLTVITELEGLSKGAEDGQNSTHKTTGSRTAVDFVKRQFSEKCAGVKALTTQGSLLSSLSFRAEVTDKVSNDDLILECCCQLHSKVDTGDKHSVVLLTDDRNLRVKAHASNLPVKDMPSFMKLFLRT